MNIGLLTQECPKCGSQDKTVKRNIEDRHKAHATTKAVLCSECGYVFISGEE